MEAVSYEAPNLAYLLGAAIVLDSYNFKADLRDKKWSKEDVAAYKFLSKTTRLGSEYWIKLINAKCNEKAGLGLGLRGLFIRDYKNYELPYGLMGVAAVNSTIDTVLDHFGEVKFAHACEDITQEKGLGLFVIVADVADSAGGL